jgi:peptidyl-prolyl cis-trans isomerase D
LAPVLKTGFEMAPNDPPEVVSLPGEAGYAIVSPGQVVRAAPSPLASIRAQVVADWIYSEATKRAQAAARQIEAKANGNISLADAIKSVGAPIPPSRPVAARRIQIADPQGNVPPALKILFTAGAGKARMAPNPGGGGFFIVKVNKIIPGNALSSPGLITQVQGELSEATAQDYAQQFLADMKRQLKAKRNESAIQGFKARLLSSGG